MEEQREKDVEAARGVMIDFDADMCVREPEAMAERIADLLAAARKEALEADPVLMLMRHPSFFEFSKSDTGKFCAGWFDNDDGKVLCTAWCPTPEAAALVALAEIGGDRE